MSYLFQPDYGEVLRSPAAIELLRPPCLGLDFEWNIRTGEPTIIGVSDGKVSVSVPFNDESWRLFLALVQRYREHWRFVGHNFIRSERVILEKHGLSIPLEQIEDTILWHYLTSAHLCKAGGKAIGDSPENERRGPGFMNIWTMCSIWTSAPCWKFCRESECHGVPCPEHNPFWYNGLDALNPVLALAEMKRRADLMGVSHLYPFHARLMEQFEIMQQRGMYVDVNYINKMREDFATDKYRLWKKGQKIPDERSLPFNPNSSPQVKDFFKTHYGLTLPNTQEETIRKFSLQMPENELLADLLAYKELGQGVERWFAERRWEKNDWVGYVVPQEGGLGLIHPNMNIFTSTSRTVCSNPNMQNVEKRRVDRRTGEKIGKKVRAAIVAPPGHLLYAADMCVLPDTKILMADLQWKRADEIAFGEKVIGFDERLGGYHPAFKAAKVVATRRIPNKVSYRITTDKGSISVSGNHWFPVRRRFKNGHRRLTWVAAEDLRIGEKISFFLSPWEEDRSYEAGWLAGFFNGEGSLGARQQSLARVSYSQNKGALLREAVQRIRERGFQTSLGSTRKKSQLSNHSKVREGWITGVGEGIRFLGVIRPSRLLKKASEQLIGKRIWSGSRPPAKILRIEPIGSQTVIGLETTSHTFIANGFLSHNSNGENRVILKFAGYEIPREQDLHDWMVANMGIKKEDEFAIKLGGPRDASKSVTHAADYMEGLQLRTPEQLRGGRMQAEIRAGARLVFPDWKFQGKIVTFTGVNLARRAFGDASFVNRRKALEATERYIGERGAFPKVRDFQRRVTAQIEQTGMVQVPEGYAMLSYERSPEDRLKSAAAMWGQSPVAHRLKMSLLNLEAHPRLTPVLGVHDETLVYASEEYSPQQVAGWIRECMEVSTNGEPGLVIPVKVKGGKNWRDTVEI